jgi:hypothetical protein
VNAAVWSLVALLGTALAVLVGAFFRLGSKIDGQGRDLGERIDAVTRDLGERIDAQTARIDVQTARIDALNARIDAHLERHTG